MVLVIYIAAASFLVVNQWNINIAATDGTNLNEKWTSSFLSLNTNGFINITTEIITETPFSGHHESLTHQDADGLTGIYESHRKEPWKAIQQQQQKQQKQQQQEQHLQPQQHKCGGSKDTMTRLRESFPVMNNNEEPKFPSWIQHLCPEVVTHFARFPYFHHYLGDLPIMTTLHAAHSVCSVQLAVQIGASIGSNVYLHAGSHLGAVLHGGPIPWDDDADLMLPYDRQGAFLGVCNGLNHTLTARHPDIAEVKCTKEAVAIKLFVITKDSIRTPKRWDWPYVDIFSFRVNQRKDHVQEVGPNGRKRDETYPISDYFPTEPYYFGGIHVLGPPRAIALKRYDPGKCVLAPFIHRLERYIFENVSNTLDCCELAKSFPFIYYDNKATSTGGGGEGAVGRPFIAIFNGGDIGRPWQSRLLLSPQETMNVTFAHETWGMGGMSVSARKQWAVVEPKGRQARNLTSQIPNLDVVEIENGFADPALCRWGSAGTPSLLPHQLRIVEFNAERGKHWLQAVKLLQDLEADVIILNEMDIGMARSDQQHTTRLLAQALGMNYAWALQFVELTGGTEEEQQATQGLENFLGLHGNAILSKCQLHDPLVIRGDDIAPYFSDKATFINANGFEKRLGGRMILLSRLQSSFEPGRNNTGPSSLPASSIVVGSTHKLKKSRAYEDKIASYISTSPAIIAGDQDWDFCGRVGLQHVDNRSHSTWPASCNSDGYARGDILCSNLDVAEAEETIRPCFKDRFGLTTVLSDHAITHVSLTL
jgi:hypothetical protein